MGANDKVNLVKHKLKSKRTSGSIANIDEYYFCSSDEEDIRNTIGNIPISRYDGYDHIGYDWEGNKIMKPKERGKVDNLIDRSDDPYYWRTVIDHSTGQRVVLTDSDIDLIQRVKHANYPDPNYDPFPEFLDLYSHEKCLHPLHNIPERKASFSCSVSERTLINKLVVKIRRSRKQPQPPKIKHDSRFTFNYDLWSTDGPITRRYKRTIIAPKMPLPTHEESYNPPPEYLFDEEEMKKWKEDDPEERRISFIPQKFPNLRSVPAYPKFVKERFERCLDLYLCPRIRKYRATVNPDDLIPQLPRPNDLYPFPCIQSLIYSGHEDIVRSIDVEPFGQYIVSGSDDRTLRVWEVLTGRCALCIKFDNPVISVKWCPNNERCLILAVSEKNVFIINPQVGSKCVIHETNKLFELEDDPNRIIPDSKLLDWIKVEKDTEEYNKGIRIIIKHKFDVQQAIWHYKGDYFGVLMPKAGHKAVVIHQLSRKNSQVPFSKSKGILKCISFHPCKAYLFVCTDNFVRVYDLIKQKLIKKLKTNCNQVSSIAIHPKGDNLLLGCYDLKLNWFDLDLSDKPYKILRYHKKAIRSVAYHSVYPLFASASDDGTTIVSHGRVYNDLLKNALIVPVKVLRGHKPCKDLAVLDCVFHPQQPWVFSCGSDGTIRLYTH